MEALWGGKRYRVVLAPHPTGASESWDPCQSWIQVQFKLASDVQSPRRSLPEAADKPAPATAIMFLEDRRSSWKALMSLDGAIWYVWVVYGCKWND
jgi:hypothetical protein